MTAVLLGTFALIAVVASGCDGGNPTGSGGAGGSSDGGSGGATGGSGGTGASGGTTTTTSTTGGGGSGGSGGTGGSAPTDNGVQGTDFVCAGGLAKSANFKMVFTLGQSTQNQGRTKSANYQMQGGLIGATGSLK